MGKRGPRPKPTILKALAGNPGKRKLNEKEPAPPAAVGVSAMPPEWLLPLGKDKWAELSALLEKQGVLTTADLDALAMYCQTYAHWRACESWVAENGRVATLRNEKGEIKYMSPTPHASLALRYAADLRRLAQEFGLTPSSRSGVTTDKPKESKLSVFLGGA